VGNYLWRLKQRNKLIGYWLVRLSSSPSSFTFRGKSYRYFWHRYNATWRNERAVEIPIARGFEESVPAAKVLEIGNVLSHYGPVAHEVVDKYEKAEGVRNEDACSFKSDKKYELILSLSTLEHVGWDEEPKDKAKVLTAFKNLQNLLSPTGRMVVTIPLGYNPFLDQMISEGEIQFSERVYLKRKPHRNEWREAGADEVRHPHYDRVAYVAHELLVGIIENGQPGNLPAIAPGSSSTPSRPRPHRPCSAPQTSGTTGCHPSAPSAAARCAPCRVPAAAGRAAASRAESRAGPADNGFPNGAAAGSRTRIAQRSDGYSASLDALGSARVLTA